MGTATPPEQPAEKKVEGILKAYLSNHLLTAFWSLVLAMGGVTLISYYFSIGFMPEYDFKSGASVFAALAAMAIVSFGAMICILIMPGAIWQMYWGEKNPLHCEGKTKGQGAFSRALCLFFIPACLWAAVIISGTGFLLKAQWWFFIVTAFIGILCFFVYSKAIISFNEGLNWKIVWGIHGAAFYCAFLLLCVFALFQAVMTKPETWGDWLIVVGVTLVLLFLNMLLALVDNTPREQLKAFTLLGVSALIVVWVGWKLNFSLPAKAMERYQLGSFNANMLFTQAGCHNLKFHNVTPEPYGADQCSLTNVRVLSRLGKITYLKQGAHAFPVNSTDVVTWSVVEPEKDQNENKLEDIHQFDFDFSRKVGGCPCSDLFRKRQT